LSEAPKLHEHSPTPRGLAILGWLFTFLLALSLGTRAAGLKYVQGVIWPSDLNTFRHLPTDVPIDVAILGSSRASFDLPPAALDRCLSEKLGRPTRTVNLARAYANSSTLRSVAHDLLVAPRTPKVLLLALEAESLDAHNPQNASYVAYQAELEDIPNSIARADTLGQFFASFRPLIRGTESLALLLSRRPLAEARLRWMMIEFGGGQYCYTGEVCDKNNRDVESSVREGWTAVEKEQLANLATERFGHYQARTGRGRDDMDALLREAKERGSKVAIVNVPLHFRWMQATPPQVTAEYLEVENALAAAHDVPIYSANTPKRQLDARDYVDDNHLTASAALELSDAVCADFLAPLLRD
jgi:hypothetical protein